MSSSKDPEAQEEKQTEPALEGACNMNLIEQQQVHQQIQQVQSPTQKRKKRRKIGKRNMIGRPEIVRIAQKYKNSLKRLDLVWVRGTNKSKIQELREAHQVLSKSFESIKFTVTLRPFLKKSKKWKKHYKYTVINNTYISNNTNISKMAYYFTNLKKAKKFVNKKNKSLKNKLYILRNIKTNKQIPT